ncbi:glycosyltransferase [Paenibacillus harenae]|uniref:Glycosyltransferase involved in cell wall biosynthesis n=1 Tax=Paenibacillus harenae TaxID=306543 RepID=A0ABT9U6G7_PAEHA|nr:glycosyltransferase [Paenibacillus harenae]MDQ0115235.1 glycosyltransferase involved in cell wall biosynthesis [Paenibacillus harenae]
MTFPTVYIVTPSRNAEETINDTISSVLTQQGDFHIRYHIQDCLSTDGTIEIIQAWGKFLDEGRFPLSCRGVTFTYASEDDTGLYDGIRKGFNQFGVVDEESFMTWINADDILCRGTLATITKIQRTLPDVNWVTGKPCQLSDDSLVYLDSFFQYPTEFIKHGFGESRFLGFFIQQEGTFWKKKVWEAAGGISTKLKLAGDFELWVKFAQQEVLWLFNGPLGIFRVRTGQLSENLDKYFNEMDAVIPLSQKEQNWQEVLRQAYSNPNQVRFSSAGIAYDYGGKKYVKNVIEFPIRNYISVSENEVEAKPVLIMPSSRTFMRKFRKAVKFLTPYGLLKLYQNRRR